MKFFNIEIGEELKAAVRERKVNNIKDDVTLIYAPTGKGPAIPQIAR